MDLQAGAIVAGSMSLCAFVAAGWEYYQNKREIRRITRRRINKLK